MAQVDIQRPFGTNYFDAVRVLLDVYGCRERFSRLGRVGVREHGILHQRERSRFFRREHRTYHAPLLGSVDVLRKHVGVRFDRVYYRVGGYERRVGVEILRRRLGRFVVRVFKSHSIRDYLHLMDSHEMENRVSNESIGRVHMRLGRFERRDWFSARFGRLGRRRRVHRSRSRVGFNFSFLRGRRNVAVERVDERVDVAFERAIESGKIASVCVNCRAKSYSRTRDGTLRTNARSNRRAIRRRAGFHRSQTTHSRVASRRRPANGRNRDGGGENYRTRRFYARTE